MANIDVSDVILDPEFSSPIQIISRIPVQNSLGENKLTETVRKTYGCVQPADGKTIERLPEGLRVADIQSFWVKGRNVIVASSPGKYSSVLVFQGMRYQVQHLFPWGHFGQGFQEGVCIAEKPA